ncbi:hypothetical protein Tco_1120977 [Tanacetum coccineum]|uniref:Uncharacterized protein n=1 Tax=Tanacetum coccineum TaxID=301880 RepID=A0ABQ5IYL9_9ASTR
MDDNELNKVDLVVVPVVDVGYLLIESEIHDVDDVIIDPDAEENFIDAPVILEKYILKHWIRDITTCVEKKHKQIWREVEVQVPKPPSRKTGDVIYDIYAVEKLKQIKHTKTTSPLIPNILQN